VSTGTPVWREKDYPGVKPGQLPRRGAVDSCAVQKVCRIGYRKYYSSFKNLIRYPTSRSPKDRTQVRVASDFLDRISGAGIFWQPPLRIVRGKPRYAVGVARNCGGWGANPLRTHVQMRARRCALPEIARKLGAAPETYAGRCGEAPGHEGGGLKLRLTLQKRKRPV
jgi:hypothetical protein